MAYTTINKSTDYFDTKLYTGTGSNITVSDIPFNPDFVWFKKRDGASASELYDQVRGATKYLISNSNDAEDTNVNGLTAFGTGGWTIGGNGLAHSGTMVAWNWKAGTTSGISTNGSTTITPTAYSFNATAGFSIIKYTGNGTTGAKYPHGLGVAPKMVIVKNLGTTDWWNVHHASLGNNSEMYLNTTDAAPGSTGNGTTPDSVNIELEGTTNTHNGSGNNYIAYCFAEKTGYSKVNKYIGNGNADGTFVYTGFKPSFILIKLSSATADWQIFDNKREGYNNVNDALYPNLNSAEGSTARIQLLSNGFKLVDNNNWGWNKDGETYTYYAVGQSLVGTNNTPCTSR